MKKRILTGIQSSGKPTLGNILGAIQPIIDLSKTNETICFIADMHSLTTLKDPVARLENSHSIFATFVALGYDPLSKRIFKQSDVPYAAELSFYLSCFSNFNIISKSHAFKEKSENLSDVNVGLFTYPILMAADILLYDVDLVPVGKDQLQHLEIARNIASNVNLTYKNSNIFKLPEPYINENLMTIPGTDGRKMSKSYNNTIDIFDEEKKLRKKIMSIQTDSTPVNDPKPTTCNVFKLYSLLCSDEQLTDMKKLYDSGIMYSEAKQALFDLIITKYAQARYYYNNIINDKEYIDDMLNFNKGFMSEIALSKMNEIKKLMGFK